MPTTRPSEDTGEGSVRLTRTGPVATVRFRNAAGRANALSPALLRDLLAVAHALDAEPGITAVVLAGGNRHFSSGFDLRDPEVAGMASAPPAAALALPRLGERLIKAWSDLPAVTIAAVEGACLGGGLALATACDFRIAGRGASFGAPEVERSLPMAWASLPRLVAILGAQPTRRLVLAGKRLAAPEALALGLADEVVADGEALVRATAFAVELAARPALALTMAKRAIAAVAHRAGEAAVALDADQFLAAVRSEGDAAGGQRLPPRRDPP